MKKQQTCDWEHLLYDDERKIFENVRPILQRAEGCNLPRISNIVSTAILLPQTKENQYKLPLDAISMSLACSQYAPILFAANIIKLTDSITNSTILVFASGKIVVTACLAMNHTRYISQLVRVIVEQVNCMILDPETQKVSQGSLLGRTVFEKCTIHNIVGNGDLGCRIDLQAMCDAAPTTCKWVPDLFPGLKCKIWLTETQTCTCNGGGSGDDEIEKVIGKHITPKCTCIVKMILYDTGQVVIIGARSVADVNSVFFRIKQEIPRLPRDEVIPKNGRFYKRLGNMMVTASSSGGSSGGTTMLKKSGPKLAHNEKNPEEALSAVMADMNIPSFSSGGSTIGARAHMPPPLKRQKINESALLKMAKAGRLDEVTIVLEIDPEQVLEKDAEGFTVLERMQMIQPQERSPFHKEIVNLLLNKRVL